MSSPHHLGATMVTDRRHRMTELFGRLAPDATLESARAELAAVHASILREHPGVDSAGAHVALQVRTLPEQLASPARSLLLLLLAAAVVYVIACSDVANLILASRTFRACRRRMARPAWAWRGAACG